MRAVSVVETELRNENIKKINVERREDVFKENCKKLYENLNLPNLPHEQRTKRTSTIETRMDKGELWECYEDTENSKIHNIKELQLTGNLDLGDKRVFEIQRIEYDVCGFCGHELIAEDYGKGVRVCEGCGTVENTYVFEKPSLKSGEDLPENDGKLRPDERNVINLERKRKARIRKTKVKQKVIHKTPTKTQRRDQYLMALSNISGQLHMNAHQYDCVEHVLLKYPLKMICTRVDHRTIIAGLCRYILVREGRGNELKFSRAVFKSNGLDKDNYGVIEKHIKAFKMFGH
jgi:hypothetical protein